MLRETQEVLLGSTPRVVAGAALSLAILGDIHDVASTVMTLDSWYGNLASSHSRWLLHVSALLFQDSQPSYTDRGVEPLLWFEHGKKPSLNDGDVVWKGRYGPRTHLIV
ncbi:hypothetical protein BHM03_00029891 [Ensete ventricosum]|nr:hypothetical protein BHM03_00029891 [Ensete ventricosum]